MSFCAGCPNTLGIMAQCPWQISNPDTTWMHHTLLAANASLVFRTLVEHSHCATEKHWSLPVLLERAIPAASGGEEQQTAHDPAHVGGGGVPGSSVVLDLQGVWPFWKGQCSMPSSPSFGCFRVCDPLFLAYALSLPLSAALCLF